MKGLELPQKQCGRGDNAKIAKVILLFWLKLGERKGIKARRPVHVRDDEAHLTVESCLESRGLGVGLDLERGWVERGRGVRVMPRFLLEQAGGGWRLP